MTLRATVVLIALAGSGFVVGGCASSPSTRLQTTDLPYTVARIRPNIEAARASNASLFSIFPPSVARRTCRIPRGGPVSKVMTLPGACSSNITYEKSRNARVTFTERWYEPSNRSRWWQHTWRVIVGADGKVVAVRSSGAAAPQSWS